jgi:hypothetical protein
MEHAKTTALPAWATALAFKPLQSAPRLDSFKMIKVIEDHLAV